MNSLLCLLVWPMPQLFIRICTKTSFRTYFLYLDDILVFFSNNECEHVQHVWKVLPGLLQNNLIVMAYKCKLQKCMVWWSASLALFPSRESIKMDQEKLKAVAEWPRPYTRKDLQFSHGFSNKLTPHSPHVIQARRAFSELWRCYISTPVSCVVTQSL